MAGLSSTALVALLVLLVALATDLWVYADARAQAAHASPVVVTFGTLKVATPAAWLAACVLLWVVFVPLYLTARGR
jgi:hypothetical protein